MPPETSRDTERWGYKESHPAGGKKGRQKKVGRRERGFWRIKKLPITKSYRELSVAGTGFEPATYRTAPPRGDSYNYTDPKPGVQAKSIICNQAHKNGVEVSHFHPVPAEATTASQ